MEQRSHKKGLTIFCITLVVILFALGITFTLLKTSRLNEAQRYNSQQTEIEGSYKDLPNLED